MLRKILFYLLFLLCLLSNNKIIAQDWIKKMQDPTVNFYDVQKSFNKYWSKEDHKQKFKSFFSFKKETEEENESAILYKRWEDYVEPRVFPYGDRSLIERGNEEIIKLINSPQNKSMMQAAGNWTAMGAFTVPDSGGGAGRLNCVKFHPTNHNIIYVGAPAGGLWKTTDGGNTWSTATDLLPTLGVEDILIDPTNTNIMYIATGDGDASDTYSVGVLKSIDGGLTWNITGLNSSTIQGQLVYRLLMNPNDHTMLFAGTSSGIYKSTDSGVTWVRVSQTGGIKDMEFKPGNPTIVYAVSANIFLKSTDAGNSFTNVNNGLPAASASNRLAIAVTPAAPGWIYVLSSSNTNSGFFGIYLSQDGGATFLLHSTTPNLLGWDVNGNDTGGQGWYTLSLAVNPTDQYEVVVGGVNVWKSPDGGFSWNIIGHWYGANGTPYVHADIHDLSYTPDGSALYATCDGGIFQTTDGGASWTDKSAGLQIGEIYRLGCSATNPDMIIQGWQDNGCNLITPAFWDHVLGGDGMECFIDWSNTSYMYAESQYGALRRSINGGANFQGITTNINETGNWITPWCIDPVNPLILYAGYKNVWKTTNRGTTWTAISSFNSGGLSSLVVANSNANYIYASDGSHIYKTIDGGAHWTTTTISGNANSIKYITISTTNPDIIWVAISGYIANDKVFKSIDGGSSWTNISLNLPNIPANCIVNQTGTADGVYVGTDLGVYYLDNNLSSWLPFSNGLPNVIIDELEIQYGSSKLRAVTYGRGLWQTPIYNPASNLPYANFKGDTLSGCPGFNVQFYDSTINSPTAWQWYFPGGTPDTSSLQNPIIIYNTPGTYNNVTLLVGNANGSDSLTKLSYIAVSPNVRPLITLTPNDTVCTHSQLTSSSAQSYHWYPSNQSNQILNVFSTGIYCVTTTDVFNCATSSDSSRIWIFPPPAIPIITVNADTLYSSSPSGNQWYMNGNIILGAVHHSYYVTNQGNDFKVIVTDSLTHCSATSSNFVGIDQINSIRVSFSIYPNPANTTTTLVLQTDTKEDIQIDITDVLGKIIYHKKITALIGRLENTIDIGLFPNGIYFLTIKNSKGMAGKKLVVY